MNIDVVLQTYKTLFENLTPQSVESDFLTVFDRKIYFKDPFNEVRGLQDLQQIFRHMFASLHEPQFRIHHLAGADKTGYLEWRFYFKTSATGTTQQINGMSKILINDQGKVIVHIDYWDSGEYVYRKIPILRTLISWINKRLRAK